MDAAILAEVTGTDCHIAPFSIKEVMSAPATAENIKQAEKEQTAPLSHVRRDSAFLVLAPVLSSSYPTAPPTSQTASSASTTASTSAATSDPSSPAVDTPTTGDVDGVLKRTRRSSSVSSAGSGLKRFLRLGPVHWGGDGAPDFVEAEE